MGNPLFATKSIDTLMKEAGETGEHSLKRALGPVNLITLGIGAIIGAGIFVFSGSGALYAGPAIMLSYVLAGVGCAFAGLCYAEFASMIPIAGSAYTYGYATLGEIVAWIIGWDLTLEYAFGAATVASGWSSTWSLLNISESRCRLSSAMTRTGRGSAEVGEVWWTVDAPCFPQHDKCAIWRDYPT